MAQITIFFMGHDFLFVHHRAHRGGQAIEHKGRGVGLVGFDGDGIGIDGPDPVTHIIGGEAELPQDEGRGFVQNDGALEGKGHVFSGQGIARSKGDPVADLERYRSCRRATPSSFPPRRHRFY